MRAIFAASQMTAHFIGAAALSFALSSAPVMAAEPDAVTPVQVQDELVMKRVQAMHQALRENMDGSDQFMRLREQVLRDFAAIRTDAPWSAEAIETIRVEMLFSAPAEAEAFLAKQLAAVPQDRPEVMAAMQAVRIQLLMAQGQLDQALALAHELWQRPALLAEDNQVGLAEFLARETFLREGVAGTEALYQAPVNAAVMAAAKRGEYSARLTEVVRGLQQLRQAGTVTSATVEPLFTKLQAAAEFIAQPWSVEVIEALRVRGDLMIALKQEQQFFQLLVELIEKTPDQHPAFRAQVQIELLDFLRTTDHAELHDMHVPMAQRFWQMYQNTAFQGRWEFAALYVRALAGSGDEQAYQAALNAIHADPQAPNQFAQQLFQAFPLKLAAGSAAPTVPALLRDGEQWTISDEAGKITVIDFWATWCGPCMAVEGERRELAAWLDEKNVKMVNVSLDHSPEVWQQFIADDPSPTKHVFADGAWQSPFVRSYRVYSIPSFIIIDADGKVSYPELRDHQSVRTAVEGMLAQAAAD